MHTALLQDALSANITPAARKESEHVGIETYWAVVPLENVYHTKLPVTKEPKQSCRVWSAAN